MLSPFDTSVIFFPRQDNDGEANSNFDVECEDGVVLKCYLRRHSAAKKCLVYFHGNGELASSCVRKSPHGLPNFIDFCATLSEWNVLFVEYRGYGQSTGTPTLFHLFNDVHAVSKHIFSRKIVDTEEDIVVMGRSLGRCVSTP